MTKRPISTRIYLFITALALPLFLSSCQVGPQPTPRTYHVSPQGSNGASGTANAPLNSINAAAQKAQPGDTVLVHAGTYREWVNPPRGGNVEQGPIVYKAASDGQVRILGSERVSGWQRQNNGLYRVSLDPDFFGDFNPFSQLTRHPEYVEADEEGDGWGWLKYGRWTHRGDIIADGKGLTERETLEDLADHPMSWFVREDNGNTILWANLADLDPSQASVEVTSRPFAFFPSKPGLSHITVEGFSFENIATHWAPPTVFQPGAIGPNGGSHWVIKNNTVLYSKAVCISIGNPNGAADKANSGYHQVIDNVLLRCGQGGIAGETWNKHSLIAGNHIEDINYREEFGGWETAGIKHHNTSNLVIKNNLIRNIYTLDPERGAAHGIWNDFKNKDWRIESNVIIGAEASSILFEANWDGYPNVFANNVIVGGQVSAYSSRGDVMLHNLFLDIEHAWGNQDWQGRPTLADSYWLNNLFIGKGLDPEIEATDFHYRHNAYLAGAKPLPQEADATTLSGEVEWALHEDETGLSLQLTLPQSAEGLNVTPVKADMINLSLTITPSVPEGFAGSPRPTDYYAPGPFVHLTPGRHSYPLLPLSERYQKAKAFIENSSAR
ncbi:right-handed parallel beta-helix repeat-containing protein [Gilvimarinus sp. SDUM040013]|uniref:Right-handed parallel beta-helix repeat-containing protein n=1 Tax=Gilvimarinus gilvus TaxID=3058038 RepID=A0ABU4S0B7_9GAMM|nr:right-handed parallel beta-helix repeat-containing protein [Gilvimarinus sp. SDUM040013]MDO3385893.1 right-handed parallel beta-helix repeat-containing protein [Gilvimarinus sp. SDUM040013]MDX6850604.1 right-handed parallel beta-helix repeat-containing protein [Gilvimarinus sp. SDUM040013]